MDEAFLEHLAGEVKAWRQDRLVSEEQARSILARYGLVEGELEERKSRVATALALLGALLVGLGAITFFAANWQALPLLSKLFLILGAVAAAHGLGYYLWFEQKTFPRVG